MRKPSSSVTASDHPCPVTYSVPVHRHSHVVERKSLKILMPTVWSVLKLLPRVSEDGSQLPNVFSIKCIITLLLYIPKLNCYNLMFYPHTVFFIIVFQILIMQCRLSESFLTTVHARTSPYKSHLSRRWWCSIDPSEISSQLPPLPNLHLARLPPKTG